MAVAPRINTDVSAALEFDGITYGNLNAVAGGDVVADVIPNSPKTIGTPFVEPLTLELGFDMDQPVYDWVASSWAGSAKPRDFSILLADFNFERTGSRQYYGALITETTVGALVAAGPKPVAKAATLTVRLQAERASERPEQGKLRGEMARKNKALSSNFKLQIDGIDCTYVSSIDSFTVKTRSNPVSVEFPNLRVAIPEARAATWKAWHQDTLVNQEQDRKDGTITLYTPNLRSEICHIELSNLGICALRRAPLPLRGEDPGRVTADLYCDRMKFVFAFA